MRHAQDCTYKQYEITSKVVGLNPDDATMRTTSTQPYLHVPIHTFKLPPKLGEIYRVRVYQLTQGHCRAFYTWVIEKLEDV